MLYSLSMTTQQATARAAEIGALALSAAQNLLDLTGNGTLAGMRRVRILTGAIARTDGTHAGRVRIAILGANPAHLDRAERAAIEAAAAECHGTGVVFAGLAS